MPPAAPHDAAPGDSSPSRVREVNRAQLEWRPVDLDALLPEDHSARMVWEYVAGLDAEVQVQALRAEVDADPARERTARQRRDHVARALARAPRDQGKDVRRVSPALQ
ncbi:MAG: hypothetical protein HY359_05435 [Candidatus Rokubacteria bacterium]|nr:hypothetical protein [Candidatus Rokubacteria bacterium]